MPDITMCDNKDCYIRELCYRYTAKPSKIQAYHTFNCAVSDDGITCYHFMIGKDGDLNDRIL